MATARINFKVIWWALRRSGATLESLATPKFSLDKIKAWADGSKFPSESDAEALAERLGIAYPMLYMEELPHEEPLEVPDRRTVDGGPLLKPSLDLLDVLDRTRARQEWYRTEIDPPRLGFVGKFPKLNTSPKVVASDMWLSLEVDEPTRTRIPNYEEFLKLLVSRAEKLGILVMRSSIVGYDTHRSLNVEEFRGFVLVDPSAPIVFINDNDAKAAQIFTLVHELAHIWIGASGVSDRNPDVSRDSRNKVELLCDKIAAEFLVPEGVFAALWSDARTTEMNMSAASQHFRVSTLVVLRRALELNRISSKVFFEKVREQYEAYKAHEDEKNKKPKEKSGGNFWASFEIRNGVKFNKAVAESVRRQKTTYAEAGALFGVGPNTVGRYLDHLGVSK